jgi:DNA helicase IV
MGLLTSPMKGLFFVFEKIATQASEELYDDEAVRGELTDLYKRLETGALDEEEFAQREAELVARLEQIEQRQERRYGHGTH